MQRLRVDHARQSRLLREIEGLAARLRAEPEAAQPALAEAMQYLLEYQHGYHHPREDQLFLLVLERAPQFADGMADLIRQHRAGQRSIERIVASLKCATPAQLRGRAGGRLARSLQVYSDHLRDHMRAEEHVFYAHSEAALRRRDWDALVAQVIPEDPMLDPARLRREYPHLAQQLAQLSTVLPGSGVVVPGAESAMAQRARETLQRHGEELAERYAETLHDTLALLRANSDQLRAAKSAGQALRSARDAFVRSWRLLVRLIARWMRFLRGLARGLGGEIWRNALPRERGDIGAVG